MQTQEIQDTTLRTLANFVIEERRAAFLETEYLDCKRRLLDSFACGLAAFHQPTCVNVRDLAIMNGGAGLSTLLGTRVRTNVEMAAFANGFLVRYLDGADTYPGGGGHPSDCWAGLLALSEHLQLSIEQLFRSVKVAYSVFHNLFVSAQLRNKGVDNAFYVTVGTAAGCAFLLGLDHKQTANAISMAVVPNISLAVARTGSLSTWKAGASANAARNGVFAAQLSAAGIQGPAMPFEGLRGLWDLTGPFKLETFDLGPSSTPRMQRAHMKQFLCDYHSQTPVLAAMQLYEKLNGESIESVQVYTYEFAHNEVASDPEKWAPNNRETADHSMPWIVAGVLISGNFGEHLFSADQLKNPIHRNLTNRVTVHEDPDLTKKFPEEIPCRINLKTSSGRRFEVEVNLPLGHPCHPMSDHQVKNKFMTLTESVIGDGAFRIFDNIWKSSPSDPVNQLMSQLYFPH